MSASDIQKAAEDAVRGGIWTDKALEQSLDWQGDQGSPAASIDERKTHRPRTKIEIEEEILAEHKISAEVIAFITEKVEKNILRSSGAENKTIIQMVEARIAEHSDKIEKWLNEQSARLSLVEASKSSSNENAIARLDEKIASIEFKLDTLASNIVGHGPEEARMIQEAHREIMKRKTTDAGDNESDLSIYQRMDDRVAELTTQVKNLEPFIDDIHATKIATVSQKQSIRKKFGKMI